MSMLRTRWAAVGAAVAVTLGAGGVSLSQAAIGSGDKPVVVAITPCRLIDTRPGDGNVGDKTSPLGPGETVTLQITGSPGECSGIPADATGAAMNVTAIRGTEQSFLTAYPADAALPNSSNLNWRAGDPPTPNKVDVGLSADGKIKLTNAFGTVHIAADLVGYYIDHHHDDRYYPKEEVDQRVTAAEAITGRGVGLPTDLAAQRTFFAETVTTTVAGQLHVSRFGLVSIGCTSGGRIYYHVVDGVPVRSSAVYVSDGSSLSTVLVGTTEDVLPAGDHEIGLGAQCYVPANYSGGASSTVFSSLSVTVIP